MKARTITVELTTTEAAALVSWALYLTDNPTDWAEAGGDEMAVDRARAKLERAIDGAPKRKR